MPTEDTYLHRDTEREDLTARIERYKGSLRYFVDPTTLEAIREIIGRMEARLEKLKYAALYDTCVMSCWYRVPGFSGGRGGSSEGARVHLASLAIRGLDPHTFFVRQCRRGRPSPRLRRPAELLERPRLRGSCIGEILHRRSIVSDRR
jgi:hypothetical protein